MLKRLTEWKAGRKISSYTGKHPVLDATLANAGRLLENMPHSQEHASIGMDKTELMETVARETLAILASDNPVQSNRLKLRSHVCTCASLAVIALEKSSDPHHLFSIKGISGALKPQAEKLFILNKKLSDMREGRTKVPVLDLLQVRHRESRFFMETFNILRQELGDSPGDRSRDWFKPFFISMCIFYEFRYRNEISLPNAFQGKELFIPVAHSTWINLIQDGEKDLRRAWEKQWESEFHLGPSPYQGLALE